MIIKGVLLLCLIFMSFLAGYLARKPSAAPIESQKSLTEEKAQTESNEDRVIERTVTTDGSIMHEIIKEKIQAKEDKHTTADKLFTAPVPSLETKKKFSLLLGAELSKELMRDKDFRVNPVIGTQYDITSNIGIQAQYSVSHKETTVLLKTSF